MRLTDFFKEQQKTLACSRAQIDHQDGQVRMFSLINLARPKNSIIENLSENGKIVVLQQQQQLTRL